MSPEFYGEALRVSNDSQETPSGIITPPQELGELRTRALEILGGSDGFTDEYLLITQGGIAGLREFGGVKISDRTYSQSYPGSLPA